MARSPAASTSGVEARLLAPEIGQEGELAGVLLEGLPEQVRQLLLGDSGEVGRHEQVLGSGVEVRGEEAPAPAPWSGD
jgi:hypothetical protein